MLKLAEGGFFPCGVEDEVLATGFGSNNAAEFRRGVALGDFDGSDGVIADDRRCLGVYDAAIGIDYYQGRVNTGSGGASR